jgi:pectate lyase
MQCIPLYNYYTLVRFFKTSKIHENAHIFFVVKAKNIALRNITIMTKGKGDMKTAHK